MEAIYKLQPHRTMHLQGFDAYGAAAALWGASDSGFTVSGVFRDTADFAVLVLWDRDDFFGHPRFAYLPDDNFTGITLAFDVHYDGLQRIDSPKFSSTDWPFINCLKTDGTLVQVRMHPDHATYVSGSYTKASADFDVVFSSPADGDILRLWYQNVEFSYTYSTSGDHLSATYSFFVQGSSTYDHNVTVNGRNYSLLENGYNSSQIATNLAALINADADVTASASTNNITITLRPGVATAVLAASDGNAGDTLQQHTASQAATDLANAINATDWVALGIEIALTATTSGATLTITADREGLDGNMIRLYSTHAGGVTLSPDAANLSGGLDDTTWNISVDFSALGLTSLQKIWITLAPELANGALYADTEWEATFTNWTVTDASGTRALKVAGPGSVRLEEYSPWVAQTGFWEPAPTDGFAFWSRGRAIRAAASGAKLTIETHCQHTHDIYVGTRLDHDCGIVQAKLDGGTPVTLDCYGSARVVRRLLFSSATAGHHTVEITLTGTKNASADGYYFYFDFLECAVASDVPDAIETRTDIGVATDYDTDHTYKLAPQRLLWNIQKLGLVGEIDHYCGVFWSKQAVVANRTIPHVTITFTGTFAAGDGIFLRIGPVGTPEIGKSVFAEDTNDSIAAHFAAFINETAVGVWAEASSNSFTIHCRSANSLFLFDYGIRHTGGSGTISWDATDLRTGAAEGDWMIDPTQNPVFNRAFRDWHADYFTTLQAAGMGVVAAFSQEIVNPPDDPGGGAVWIQRWWDNTPVSTATGFGTLNSSQCCFAGPMLDYTKRVHATMAGLLDAAGFTPRLQFGEVLWWFQKNASGMAFYDADTKADFLAANGRALVHFLTENDDPAVNSYVDADFLRARLKAYVDAIRTHVLATYAGAQFELLWPLDVNDPDIRRLNRYVNLPTAWETRSGSGFDTFMVEGFEYGGVDHDIDKAARCAAYPIAELSWDRSYCRYLMGLYYSGWPFEREYRKTARNRGALLKTWAYDHLCLFGWPLPIGLEDNSAGLS